MTGVQWISSENRALYEKKMEKYCTARQSEMSIWRMRIAYWITTHTHTHTMCNTYRFHCSNVCMNGPLSYIIHILPVLFVLTLRERNTLIICKFFCLEFDSFLNYFFVSTVSVILSETNFVTKVKFTISASLSPRYGSVFIRAMWGSCQAIFPPKCW
jgi:hypothetical protein